MLKVAVLTSGGPMLRYTKCRINLQEVGYFSFKSYQKLGLYHLGLCPDLKVEGIDYKFLGIISKNREEWAIADLACLRSSITIVPFYDSLGADVIAFVLNQTELTTICCEVKAIDTITKLKKEGKVEHLKALVAFDSVTEEKT